MQQRNIWIILVAITTLFFGCKKRTSPTDHIPKMTGVRHWHGTETFREYRLDSVGNLYPFDSIIRYIDDTFSIIVVNSKEIFSTINHRSLYYDYADESILRFSDINDLGHGYSYDRYIFYYYLKNKMKFSSFYYPTSMKSWNISLETL